MALEGEAALAGGSVVQGKGVGGGGGGQMEDIGRRRAGPDGGGIALEGDEAPAGGVSAEIQRICLIDGVGVAALLGAWLIDRFAAAP